MTPTSTPRSTAAAPAWSTLRRTDDVVLLHAASAGEVRPDDPLPAFARALVTIHRAGIVGAKRLSHDGRLHSMGEMVIHPKGFHSIGRGLPAEAFGYPEEVDAITGGVMAVRPDLFNELGGETAFSGALDALAACLEARRRGWRIITLPEVIVADDAKVDCSTAEHESLVLRFGFDWRSPDLDAVRRLHAGTGLLWNARFLGGPARYLKYESRPALHWKSYAEVATYRSRAEAIVKFIVDQATTLLSRGTSGVAGLALLDFGCGDGLFSHLFAQRGFSVTGVDVESSAIAQAREKTDQQAYPGPRPAFRPVEPGPLPIPAASIDVAVMLDVIEHLPNPVAVLQDLRCVLKPGGVLAVVTPEWQYGGWSDAIYHICEYTLDELASQVRTCGFAPMQAGRVGAPYRDVILVAKSGAA